MYQRVNNHIDQQKHAIKAFKRFLLKQNSLIMPMDLLKGHPAGKEHEYNLKPTFCRMKMPNTILSLGLITYLVVI